ncbi:MAG TPA: hypothetical protein VJC09_03295 [Candidatus Saccharimonadales bacterium]|nr:hypothetical protein [Candidatus Saccharimonadales bacterium]
MSKTKHSPTPKEPVSSFELFNLSASAVQRNLSAFTVLNLLPAAMMLGSAISSSRRDQQANDLSGIGSLTGLPTYAIASFAGIGLAIFLLVILASLIIRAMLYALQLEVAKGKTPELADIWQVGKKYWLRLLGLGIVVSVFVIGGLFLLIVPGLIMLRRYFLSPYVLIEKDTSISEAMRISAEISKPYSGSIWGIIGVSILLSLPSFIPVIGSIVSFVLAMLYSVAPALRYQELKKLAKT